MLPPAAVELYNSLVSQLLHEMRSFWFCLWLRLSNCVVFCARSNQSVVSAAWVLALCCAAHVKGEASR
jgi:hypothetical protein